MASPPTPQNRTLLQTFEWHTHSSPDHSHYAHLTNLLPALRELGITALWLPPGCKAANPHGNGYDIYDLWDLGEFEQKGSRSTKWGSREELDEVINKAKEVGLEVVWDAVINHKTGADGTEEVWAVEVDKEDRRYEICPPKKIKAWLRFDSPGRQQHDGMQYSSMKWRGEHFNGVDWDQRMQTKAIYKLIDDPATLPKPFVQPQRRPPPPSTPAISRLAALKRRFIPDKIQQAPATPPARRPGKGWAEDVDKTHGNNDFLLCTNIDYTHPSVRADILNWGKWIISDIGVDGFRLDAVQHFSFNYTRSWIQQINASSVQKHGKEAFIIGEVWSGDLARILPWLDAVQQHPSQGPRIYVFDAPLFYNFARISTDIRTRSKNTDLRTLLRSSLLSTRPEAAVTLVTNHDTQPGQAMSTPMEGELKVMWYAFILLRREGLPCVFWGDLFGIEGPHAEAPVGVGQDGESALAKLMLCRRFFAYGEERDYWISASTIAWTRGGTVEGPSSGCAVVLNLSPKPLGESVKLQLGAPGDVYTDVLSPNIRTEVVIDREGWGVFLPRRVLPGVSVFVRKEVVGLVKVPEGMFGG